jgi:hypothetical protein
MKKLNEKIGRIKLYLIAAMIIIALIPNTASAQIDLKKLKNKAKEKISGNKDDNQNQNPNSNNTNLSAGNKSVDDFTEMGNFYSSKTYLLGQYPFVHYNFGAFEWTQTSLDVINEFDMQATLQRMEQDKQKYPKLFMVYPKSLPTSGMNVMTRNDIPAFADKAGETEDFPYKDENAAKVKDFYETYVFWKNVSSGKQRDVAQMLNKMISTAETGLSSEKLDKIGMAEKCLLALKSIQPENVMIADIEKRIFQAKEKIYQDLGDVITGEFHKKYVKKLVGFSSKPVIGKENESAVTNEIIPGKPFYIVGYLPEKLKNLSITGHIKGIPYTIPPKLEWSQLGVDNNSGRMQLYWNESMLEAVKEQSYYIFEMFPDVNSINFKSHVEYIPIMNMVKWFTYQLPGEYEFDFKYVGSMNHPFVAQNTFKVKLTPESIEDIKAYYNKLAEKKLKAVTINNAAGCTDQKARIGGKDAMKKYGEAIKITCAESGRVMKPWPNENQVEYYTGFGYGVFKRTDGKYEIIRLDFRRSPSSSEFDFSGANTMSHYEIEGDTNIRSETLNLGYEITKEGIEKCTMW